MKNQGDNLCPEFIVEPVTPLKSFVFGVVISASVGGQDLGLPCPLFSAPVATGPLLRTATSHQHFQTWIWWTPPHPLQKGQDVIHASVLVDSALDISDHTYS